MLGGSTYCVDEFPLAFKRSLCVSIERFSPSLPGIHAVNSNDGKQMLFPSLSPHYLNLSRYSLEIVETASTVRPGGQPNVRKQSRP